MSVAGGNSCVLSVAEVEIAVSVAEVEIAVSVVAEVEP